MDRHRPKICPLSFNLGASEWPCTVTNYCAAEAGQTVMSPLSSVALLNSSLQLNLWTFILQSFEFVVCMPVLKQPLYWCTFSKHMKQAEYYIRKMMFCCRVEE